MVCPTISEWQGRKTTLSPCKHEKQNQRKSGETRRPSVFHEIPRAAGPVQQTTKSDRLRHYVLLPIRQANQGEYTVRLLCNRNPRATSPCCSPSCLRPPVRSAPRNSSVLCPRRPHICFSCRCTPACAMPNGTCASKFCGM